MKLHFTAKFPSGETRILTTHQNTDLFAFKFCAYLQAGATIDKVRGGTILKEYTLPSILREIEEDEGYKIWRSQRATA